jgi:hypothetical protein
MVSVTSKHSLVRCDSKNNTTIVSSWRIMEVYKMVLSDELVISEPSTAY